MTTTGTGRAAEAAAAEFLEGRGFKVLAKNWQPRVCEVDLIASRKKVIYFVKVKYRRGNSQGSGLEYITHAKQRQMRFAAELWVDENNWRGAYQLAAIEVSGEDFAITNFIDSI